MRGQVAEHAFGIGGGFGHVLDEGGLHLVAVLFFHGLAAGVVGVGPAGIADRADVDEGDLERLGLLLGDGSGGPSRTFRRFFGFFLAAARESQHGGGSQCGKGFPARDDHDFSL